MNIGFENEKISLRQIRDLVASGDYEIPHLKKTYVIRQDSSDSEFEEILKAMNNDLKNGDVIYTSTLANFGMAYDKMIHRVNALSENGICVIAIDEGFTSDSNAGAAFAAIEEVLKKYKTACYKSGILSRQKAQVAGRVNRGGRKKLDPAEIEGFDANLQKYLRREITKETFAKNIYVSKPTLNRLLKTVKGGEKRWKTG